MIFFWIVVFIVSLFALVKGADWLLESSEKIGLKIGLSPFIIGVTIVAFGTSFPELVSSFVAVSQGVTEFVVANAVGSNIANILLIVGIATIVAKRLVVTKDLIDLDLPLIALATAIFWFVARDGLITLVDALFLTATYIIYLGFSLIYKDDKSQKQPARPKIKPIDLLMLVIGIIGLGVGAKYLIDSVIALSDILDVAPGVITISAVAFGTSLPELIVSVKAAMNRQSEIALGNIFGSNVFNVLAVVGIPGIFANLHIDEQTLNLGIPVLLTATVLFIFSGISRRVHVQEGALYLVLYALFVASLFGLL